MAVVAAGALIANLPIVTLINMYGPRYMFTAVGLFGAIATACVPLALRTGWYWFLFIRVLQGIAFAGDMATFGSFMNYWTYFKQNAFFTSTLCVYVQLAPVFTNPISGLICGSSVGWPGIYYVHAAVSAMLFVIFFFTYRNFPDEHPRVSHIERGKIARGRELGIDYTKRIPYKAILSSPAAWAVFIGGLGNFAGINLLYQFSPTYLNKVQGYKVLSTGFVAALPPLGMATMKELSGLSNDRIRCITETVKTKIYNSISFFSMAVFLCILSFIPANSGSIALIIMTIGATLQGFNTGGFYKNGSVIAGPYAPFVMGQISTAMTITMLVIPLIVNPLTPNNTQDEWALAFYAVAAIMVVCNILYCFMASGEQQYWAKSEYWRKIDADKVDAELNKHSKFRNDIVSAA
uniref:Major facilitator superfamily (MFS) profile domain-containing protein n=1 Tax=Panagrolaimus sp. PS1159 TaxID=55785 RepID=A0AC35F0X2_9BILA